MNLNFFTRCCLYDKTLLEQKQRILAPSVDGARRRQSDRNTKNDHAQRSPFPGGSSGRFYKKHATKKKPL